MEWSTFFGALAGGAVGVLVTLGGFIVWDEFSRRTQTKLEAPKPPSLDYTLESYLEQYIIQKFDSLFPGWSIYAVNIDASASETGARPLGVRYRTEAGEIDILCIDSEGNFVVVELKRNKAPDTVVAQTDRYIAWVEKTLAQPNKQVRGLIIAKSFDKHLAYTLANRNNLNFWTYNWKLEFDKGAIKRVLQKENMALDKANEVEVSS